MASTVVTAPVTVAKAFSPSQRPSFRTTATVALPCVNMPQAFANGSRCA